MRSMFDAKKSACGLALVTLCLFGCATKPPSTHRATDIDLATTQPFYWLDKPSAATVGNFQFQPLWDACEKVAREYLFQLDRQDYRLGLITTKPMISKQLLEPWRKDAGTFHAVLANSLATIRRTLRFEIDRDDDGLYVVKPKVLVEQETILERRITSASQYRTAFSGPAVGSRTALDQETEIPIVYWTPIGRDSEMEIHIAAAIGNKLKK